MVILVHRPDVVVGAQPYSHFPDVCGEGGFIRALLWTLLIARFWRFAVVVFGVLAVAWTLDATGGVPSVSYTHLTLPTKRIV